MRRPSSQHDWSERTNSTWSRDGPGKGPCWSRVFQNVKTVSFGAWRINYASQLSPGTCSGTSGTICRLWAHVCCKRQRVGTELSPNVSSFTGAFHLCGMFDSSLEILSRQILTCRWLDLSIMNRRSGPFFEGNITICSISSATIATDFAGYDLFSEPELGAWIFVWGFWLFLVKERIKGI